MNESPLISVVIPNYNGKRFIADTIQSVLRQSYTNFELIIVDDSSTDGSIDILKVFSKKDKRITLILNNQNHGVSSVRNQGIQFSTGKYIALLDNDDLWEEDKLERQLAIAEQGFEIVYCSYDFIDEHGKPIKRPFIVPEMTSFRSMLQSSVISCSTAFIKADIFKKFSFSSDFYHEDYVMWMNLLRLPIKAKGDKKVLMHYRQTSRSRSSKKINAARERWIIYRKALDLDIFTSIFAFISYSVRGIFKYYL